MRVHVILTQRLQQAEELWQQELTLINELGLSPGAFACDAWYP
jgi:hypothetical protein